MSNLFQTRSVDNTAWYAKVIDQLNTSNKAIWQQPIKQINNYEYELVLKEYPDISINMTFHGEIAESLIVALRMNHSLKLSFIDLIKILGVRDILRDITRAKTILYKELLD